MEKNVLIDILSDIKTDCIINAKVILKNKKNIQILSRNLGKTRTLIGFLAGAAGCMIFKQSKQIKALEKKIEDLKEDISYENHHNKIKKLAE